MWTDVYTVKVLSVFYLVSLSIQVPQNNAVASSSRSTPSTYPLPPASSSLTTIHNNSSSDLALGFIKTHRIRISFFSASSGLEMEMQEVGEEGLITRDNNYFWRYPRWINDSGEWVLSPDFQMRLATIDNTTMSTMTRTLQMRLVKVL